MRYRCDALPDDEVPGHVLLRIQAASGASAAALDAAPEHFGTPPGDLAWPWEHRRDDVARLVVRVSP